MKRINKILVAALGVQLVLAGGLFVGQHSFDPAQLSQPLISFAPAAVDRILIVDDRAQQSMLVKQEDQWHLPRYHGLPADSIRVKQALDRLAGLRGGWPVATTGGARERFQVSAGKFQRRITLFDGDKELGQLYLGTSPGFRKIHARSGDGEEVFSVSFNSYEVPAEDVGWLDKRLLQPKGEISAIEGPDFSVTMKGDKWQPQAAGDNLEVAANKVEALISDLESLRAIEAADEETAGELSARDPDYRLRIESGGQALEYRLYAEGEDHFVASDGFSLPFKIAKSDYERLSSYKGEQIVQHPEAPASKQPGDSTG